jgi:imidazolonepropionase
MSSENESRPQKGAKSAVINCAQVVTLAGPMRPRVRAELRELRIVSNGGLVVRDGLIERVGTSSEIERSIDADTTVVDAGGRVLLPGFVDAHTHPVFAGTRVDEFEERSQGTTYQEIAARGGGIQSTVNRTRAASVDDLVKTGQRCC